MRTLSLLLCIFIGRTTGHPLCYVGDRPTDPGLVLEFCPQPQQGACCTDLEEAEVETIFNAAGYITEGCAEFYKQVGGIQLRGWSNVGSFEYAPHST